MIVFVSNFEIVEKLVGCYLIIGVVCVFVCVYRCIVKLINFKKEGCWLCDGVCDIVL